MDAYREPDDAVWRIPYIFHGPVVRAVVKDVPLRFKGRPGWEWFLLVICWVALWRPAGWLVSLIGIETAVVAFPVKVIPAFFAASWVANWVYVHGIAGDRSPAYLARVGIVEVRRVLWSRGPVDPAVFGLGVAIWLVFYLVLVTVVPTVDLWWTLLAAPVARIVARAAVQRLEPAERCVRRQFARAERAGPSAAALTLGTVPLKETTRG